MQKKIQIVVVGVVILLIAVGLIVLKGRGNSSSEQEKLNVDKEIEQIESELISISINLPDGESFYFQTDVFNGTLFEMMKKFETEQGLEFSGKQYDWGFMITAMGGYEAKENEAWVYEVNGKEAQVGVSAYQVQAGDKFAFKIITY